MTIVRDKPMVTGKKSQDLLSKLHSDLSSGQYKPGQQFHSINDLCKTYRVSSATVVKCLSHLENNGTLSRKHGSGTYVCKIPNVTTLEEYASAKSGTMPCIDFVAPDNLELRSGLHYFYDLFSLIRSKLSQDDISMRVSFLPTNITDRETMEQWLQRRQQSGTRAFIFRWMPRIAQEIVCEKGWLTCIDGHPDTGISLPFVDCDQEQIGEIIAEHLIKRGCQQVGVLMRAEWRIGDRIMFNSLFHHLQGRVVAIETSPQTALELDSSVHRLLDIKPSIDAMVIRGDPSPWLVKHTHELVSGERGITIITAMSDTSWHPLVLTITPDGPGLGDVFREYLEILLAGDRPKPDGTLIKMKVVYGSNDPELHKQLRGNSNLSVSE